MRKIHSKNGMTLVELIIAVAFTAIVIAAACSVLYLAGGFFKSGTANAANQQKTSLAESYLQRYAATASEVTVTSSPGPTGVVFSLSGDVLSINDGTKTSIDGIGRVILNIDGKLLNYSIVSKDGSYTLEGGIVLNNCKSGTLPSVDLDGVNGKCLSFIFPPS